jgi:hypothetical protein
MHQVMENKEPRGSISAKNGLILGVVFAFAFTLLIWYLGPDLRHFIVTFQSRIETWYYPWQLPSRDGAGMTVVWGLYLAHQGLVWSLIYWAQKNLLTEKTQPATKLLKYNLTAFAVNIVFTFLHLAQTHIWFDGLAKDTPILTSQGSVIIMLAIILVIENARRGLILGKRAGKPFTPSVMSWFRHNHMYIIAWALVYTFWFHPMATDPQLLSGFFYMFLLFTQMSLAYTWVHIDKRWIVLLESFVAIHAVFVAVYNTLFFGGPDMWPMFFSGFAFMFVFTYIYAFKQPRWVNGIVTAIYAAFIVWLYAPFGYARGFSIALRLEALWIPIILYGLAIAFAGVAYLKIRK